MELDLHELGAVGSALVVDVRPCPAIPTGPGQVITATFKHASADVIDLVLSDYPVSIPHSGLSVLNPPTTDPTSSPETIGVTGNHPFWSVDRAEFVQAGELAIGERLQTLGGDIRWVQQKLPRPGPEPVYNLEVHGEHVYYVGNSGVLAHNAGCGPQVQVRPNGAKHILRGNQLIVKENHFHDIVKVFQTYNGRLNLFSLKFWRHVLPHRHIYTLPSAPTKLNANWRKTFENSKASKITKGFWEFW